ncbi:MAG: hypothetical protein CMP70_03445 [Flavobacteriales bacterium]|nr:hypothetical protein [Flavobacteriales bacterium]
MRKVLIVLRHDANSKPGGDSNLLEHISSLLPDCQTDIVHGVPLSVVDYEYVISSNLDRPIEGYELLKLCKKSSTPLHFMTLHHYSNEAISNYLKNGLYGWKYLIALISNFNPIKYEQFLWNLRVIISYFKNGPSLRFGNVVKAQKKLINECDYLLIVSQDELASIKRDFGITKAKIIEFPHVLKNNIDVNSKSAKKNLIFCPGRIECRKNQIFLLDVAESLPEIEFLFMGSINKSDKRYVSKFLKKANGLQNVRISPALGVEEFNSFLNSSDIVLTSSWFEVTSLIELQVLRNKRKLVCNALSYNSSFFKNSLVYDHNNVVSCRQKILQAFNDNYSVFGNYPTSKGIIDNYIKKICELK